MVIMEKHKKHMKTLDLANKTVVILGGAGLLGSEFARATQSAGADVIAVDLDESKGKELARKTNVRFFHADITDPQSLTHLVTLIQKEYDSIDGLVHAAYPKTKNYGTSLEDSEPKEILKNLDLQLGGALISTKAFLPLLDEKKGGSIIFLSSIYGIASPRFEIYKGNVVPVPVEYAATKGGIISLTRYFAAYLGKRNIRVNAISPGGICNNQPKDFVREYKKRLLIGSHLLSPQDISGAVVFFLSDGAGHITGQNLVIDGGWTL